MLQNSIIRKIENLATPGNKFNINIITQREISIQKRN